MNDASGEHIERHVQEIEQQAPGGTAQDVKLDMCQAIQSTHAHVDPTRWWFASSAFPMIAGTLGPVASAFSICALVQPWRQHLAPGADVNLAPFVADPSWLIVVNAIQLVVAIVANLFLLLNMAKRVRFTVAMPITIVGWYLSAICLVALVASAAVHLVLSSPNSERMWSQAFWYGIFAGLLYFVVASLLVVTAWDANKGRYEKDFRLTASQRTLMLQTIMFLMYLLLGALVFSTIEGWHYLDAVYWADVTLFTVGFGDIRATTMLGRGLLFPYAFIGVISLGLVIGSIRSLVLERGRRMLDARMIEKKRRGLVKCLTDHNEDDILTPVRNERGGDAVDKEREGHSSPPPPRTTKTGLSELERRATEFRLMRRIQQSAAKRRRWVAMALSTSVWLVLWLLGAFIFKNSEEPYQGWTYFDGVYFCFVSLTTIGYGDITPVSNPGRAFFVFWSLLALPTMTVLISNAGDTVVRSIRDTTNQLGGITILPGDQGALRDVKAILHTMSCGLLFAEDDIVEESPPGFLGQARIRRLSGDDEDSENDEDSRSLQKFRSEEALEDEERVLEGSSRARHRAQRKRPEPGPEGPPAALAQDTVRLRGRQNDTGKGGFREDIEGSASPASNPTGFSETSPGPQASNTKPSASPQPPRRGISLPPIPADRAGYHILLIDEIARVSQHMKQKPAKKYSFVEWAWYLRLLGEDESSAQTHRRATPHVHRRAARRRAASSSSSSVNQSAHRLTEKGDVDSGSTAAPRISGSDGKGPGDGGEPAAHDGSWSWIGSRSPLMGRQDEAEWIHERLVMRLAEELRSARRGRDEE
ncbi:hypothetical protein MAPG_11116 [Magnaporthiopsis poae ATCC 64411]|uniref:Potassium channel domain-containing protein n=1 Tax=Magnaporthiopsis poae (strain ATCC 64411 / 73-15) TaxID=644358 RepID=A0A0C4EEE3_MAGP6|nr:hypothetical protein MAPG_11116 [Magnaporthiopsis poae ATCC 64411]